MFFFASRAPRLQWTVAIVCKGSLTPARDPLHAGWRERFVVCPSAHTSFTRQAGGYQRQLKAAG